MIAETVRAEPAATHRAGGTVARAIHAVGHA